MGSYEKAKGRSKGRFVSLPHHLIDSDAWRSLSSNAQALMIHLIKRYNGKNNGMISLSCREAGDLLNVSKNTAALNFDELIKTGFIKITEDSAFNCKYKKSRRWALTHLLRNDLGSKRPPTNEWKKWKEDKN